MRAFLFERSFDCPRSELPPEPAPPPEPTITVREAEAQIRDARRQGFDAGFNEGAEQTREELGEQIKMRIAESLEAVRRELPRADSDLSEVLADIEVRATRVILSLLSHFAPRLSDVIAKGLAHDLVVKALSVAGKTPELIIECSPDVTAFIKDAFGGEGSCGVAGGGPPVTVTSDARLEGAAVRVRWESGEVVWDPADTEAEVAALLDAAAATLDALAQPKNAPGEVH
ncbi:MAG: hypothetical protein ACFB6R_17910 [Alphaproteobacteria bacterium]